MIFQAPILKTPRNDQGDFVYQRWREGFAVERSGESDANMGVRGLLRFLITVMVVGRFVQLGQNDVPIGESSAYFDDKNEYE